MSNYCVVNYFGHSSIIILNSPENIDKAISLLTKTVITTLNNCKTSVDYRNFYPSKYLLLILNIQYILFNHNKIFQCFQVGKFCLNREIFCKPSRTISNLRDYFQPSRPFSNIWGLFKSLRTFVNLQEHYHSYQ